MHLLHIWVIEALTVMPWRRMGACGVGAALNLPCVWAIEALALTWIFHVLGRLL